MKNEKQTSNLNFNVQLIWKSENHRFWCFLSQLQYKNENQNLLISYFNLSKKRNGTLGTLTVKYSLLHRLITEALKNGDMKTVTSALSENL